MQQLPSGRDGAIYRQNDTVIRPLQPWSPTIHKLLTHLQEHGFTQAPTFIRVDGEHEVLSFVPGETFNYPLKGPIASEKAIHSAASLLRSLHETTASFLKSHPTDSHTWMLPAQTPAEVICHGDFTPYNVALNGEEVVGVFDFDTAHPGPRVWDLAFSVYTWAPFKTDPADALGDLHAQIQRAKRFCEAYGASEGQRNALVDAIIGRLNALVAFMREQAAQGNIQFQTDLDQGHHHGYLADIDYLRSNRQAITNGLQAGP